MLDVRVLGPIEVHDGDGVIDLGSRAQRAVLAALARARGGTVAVSDLAELVWGEDEPTHPQDALKSHVSRLRRALGEDIITARPPGYALVVASEQLDVHRFEHGVGAASTLAEVEVALALWRGQPYGEFGDHPHFAGEVARLTELHVQARLRRAALLVQVDLHEEAAATYAQLVAEQPLREAAWIGLLRCLHAAGRQAEAIGEARRYREHIRDAGLDPSPRFLEVERQVFTTAPEAVSRSRTAASFPMPLSSLVGRDRELADLAQPLRDRRLVTLIGPGGVGKTTLAMHAARAVVNGLADGGWFVPLAEIDDPGSVVAAMVRAVRAPAKEPLDRALEHYLAGQEAVLVIDNAEHVLTDVRRVITRLLAVAGDLRVLVTSRQPMEVSGEVVVPVAPLDLQAAVTLLRERARDAGSPIPSEQAELAAEVCDHVGRLPLAIEMAAARLRGLDLADLSARLGESLRLLRSGEQGRHETLAAVVGWSYELLDAAHRSLLDQLSVFAGPFDLDAAEAVGDGADVAAGVSGLVDRSLVQRLDAPGPARFQLYAAVRSFAVEQLAAGQAHRATVHRFVRYHAALARQIGEGLRGPSESAWAEVVEAQLPNLEAAHAHALQTEDVDAAVTLAASLYVFIYHRLRADIGAWAEATLPLAQRTGHQGLPAVAAVAALNRLHRGDFDGVEALLVDLPDDPIARHAHEVLGDLHIYRGELDTSLDHFSRAERLARQADDAFTALHSRMSQAMVTGYAGRVEKGLEQVEAVRREGADAGIEVVAAWCDFTTAELLAEREPERALELVDRVVEQADRAGWWFGAGVARLTASSLRARTADPEDAIPGFERLIRHWARVGDETHQWTTLRNLVDLFIRLEAYEPAARLLGAVGAAPRPSFGVEEERLEAAHAALERHLGADVQRLTEVGRRDGIAAAVGSALSALGGLAGGGRSPTPTEKP